MKQYCRYCIHCYTGNGNWCDAKEKEYSDSYFKSVNNCKQFEFCEIDAFFENEKPYKPREEYRKRKESTQLDMVSMFEHGEKGYE